MTHTVPSSVTHFYQLPSSAFRSDTEEHTAIEARLQEAKDKGQIDETSYDAFTEVVDEFLYNDPEGVKEFFLGAEHQTAVRGPNNETLLLFVVQHDLSPTFERLLDDLQNQAEAAKIVDFLNMRDDNGNTALSAAVANGNLNIVKKLMDAGADASDPALFEKAKNPDVLQLLLEKKFMDAGADA